MAGLYEWTGSGYTKRAPRYWNGSAFVAPSAVWVWSGGAWVKAWPTFTRQQVYGGIATGGFSQELVANGWTSDATYPGVPATGGLTAQGAGAATITATGQFGNFNGDLSLWINGTKVADPVRSGTLRTATWSGPVADGDLIQMWAAAFSGYVSDLRIDVNPT